MNDQEKFDQFLDLCKRMAERMQRDGTWPWKDSPESEDMVESEDNENDI